MNEGDSTKDLRDRFDNLLENLKTSPVPVPASPDGKYGPDIVKYDDVRSFFFSGLYSPLATYGPLASALTDLVQGNGTLFSIKKSEGFEPFCPSGTCGKDPVPYNPGCQLPGSNAEVTYSILCTDGDERGRTREGYKAIWEATKAESSLFGDIWTSIHTGCIGWNIRPKWRFTGLYTHHHPHTSLY